MRDTMAISLQFLMIAPHFVRKGCARPVNLLQFLTINLHFVRKGCARQDEIAILPQFLTIDFIISCERVAIDASLDGTPPLKREERTSEEEKRKEKEERRREM